VGYYYNSSFVSFALAEAWNGTSWSIQKTPQLAPDSHVLRAVSCTSPSACTAVGSLGYATLAEVWNGTSWSVQKTPQLPPGSGLNALTGGSCISARACTAVGDTYDATRAEAWNGTSWSIQPTPSPVIYFGP